MSFRSGFVTIIGRPNSGKSTLLNCLMNEKVSIISNKPQTTRNIIRGIATDEKCQIIFIDTPGIYRASNKLGEFMVKAAESTFDSVDVIVYIVDVSKKGVYRGEEYILELLKKTNKPIVLVLNKIDLLSDISKVLPLINEFSKAIEFKAILPVSAIKNDGIESVLTSIKEYLVEGPKFFPGDIYTDQTERFLVSEVIREKLFALLNKEIPYGIHVEIVSFQEKSEKNIIDISANIFCEKKSHKSIIIGKNGSLLKKVGTQARLDIEKILGIRIFLELWVKVRNEWRNDDSFLKEMGYKQEGK